MPALLAAVAVALAVGHEVATSTAPSPGRPVESAATGVAVGSDTMFGGFAASPRPFRHDRHQAVSCGACHASEDDPAIVTVRTALDCASCHHDAVRGYTCQACHTLESIGQVRSVDAQMNLTVWDAPRVRALPFDHGRHGGVECRSCHAAAVTLDVTVGCTACHQDHHRPEADCTRCHVPATPGAHGLESHLTCAGAGCHGDAVNDRPTLTRALCLTCHVDQVDHEPGLTCQRCHMIPENPPARGGGVAEMVRQWLR